MLNTKTKTQLTELLAFARSAIQSIESMLIRGQRPAMVLATVPANGRPQPVSFISRDRGYDVVAGIKANAAVCMHADPVTQVWRSLDFGKTKTGNPHFQPSRFAT